mmetsp:Transcript_60717/g.140229  ORF Transcript_60717/g.140229 Transcript_60717/m.140229 type:complete len:649 (-) Transcript_60717:185-2131(-)
MLRKRTGQALGEDAMALSVTAAPCTRAKTPGERRGLAPPLLRGSRLVDSLTPGQAGIRGSVANFAADRGRLNGRGKRDLEAPEAVVERESPKWRPSLQSSGMKLRPSTPMGRKSDRDRLNSVSELLRRESDQRPRRRAKEGKPWDQVVIHVLDERHGISKDFSCPHDVLINNMRYFDSYLTDTEEDMIISVHCDIKIFQWLIDHMRGTNTSELEVNNVVSILVSADFLQMQGLVESCIVFMAANVNQVLRLPIDLSCLTDEIVRRLADQFTEEKLDSIRDRKDKLLSKLFQRKVEAMATQSGGCSLRKCTLCGTFFTEGIDEVQMCKRAKLTTTFNGAVSARHVVDPGWSSWEYATHLHEDKGLSWKQIHYWLWASTLVFVCAVCGRRFLGKDLSTCAHHPQPVEFAPGRNDGHYPCCKQAVVRFDTAPDLRAAGCEFTTHTVEEGYSGTSAEAHMLFGVLQGRSELIGATCEQLEAGEAEPGHWNDDDGDGDGGYPAEGDGAGEAAPQVASFFYCFDPPPENRGLVPEAFDPPPAGRKKRPPPRARSRGDDGRGRGRGEEEPRRAKEGAGSFFAMSFPQGTAGKKQQEYMADVLQEDDRRRMEFMVRIIADSRTHDDAKGSPPRPLSAPAEKPRAASNTRRPKSRGA